MYLPLAGHKEKRNTSEEMKIPPVRINIGQNFVDSPQKTAEMQQETQKIGAPDINKSAGEQSCSDMSTTHKNTTNAYYDNSMSTQDFMVLRTQTQDEPLKILDEVIASMKENMKETGEALEKLVEMVKKTSESEVALKLLEKTLEAMDETSAKE